MNQDSVFGERKQVSLLVIAAVMVLAGAILVGQLLSSVDVTGRPAPVAEQGSGVAGGAAASLASPSQALLDRDLKEIWRAQIGLPGSRNAIAAPGQSLLDADLKAIWRANVAAPTGTAPDLLDRDLKEISRTNQALTAGNNASAALLDYELKEVWRAQISLPGSANALAAPGQSILDTDLKAIWRANVAAPTGAAPGLLDRDLKTIWRANMAASSAETS